MQHNRYASDDKAAHCYPIPWSRPSLLGHIGMRAAKEDLSADPVGPVFLADRALDPYCSSNRLGCGGNVAATSLAFDHQGWIRQRRLHARSIPLRAVERRIKSEYLLSFQSRERSGHAKQLLITCGQKQQQRTQTKKVTKSAKKH